MSEFNYPDEGAIHEEGHAFRLVRLRSGTGSDINCELFKSFLHKNENGIPYEALSYTWGGDDKTHRIFVNGKRFMVTRNLYVALEHLRCNEDRLLWIDAICIDQSHSKERNQQVGHMSAIYKDADRVIFWLGEANFEIDALMNSLQLLEKASLHVVCNDWLIDDVRWYYLWMSTDPGHENPNYLRGLMHILARPWFKRCWILQEVAHAKVARVACGTRSVAARIFALGPMLLRTKPVPHCQAVLDIMPGPSRNSSWWSRGRELYHLLVKFGDSEASDPRDKIYALLGMASDSDATGFPKVDYDLSLQQIYFDTTSFLIPSRIPETSSHRLLGFSTFVSRFQNMNNSALKDAIKKADRSLVDQILPRVGIDLYFLNSLAFRLWQPLVWALKNHDSMFAEWLHHSYDVDGYVSTIHKSRAVTVSRNVSSPDEKGRTLLHEAVASSNLFAVKLLLTCSSIDVNFKDHSGNTPLHLAAQKGDTSLIDSLLAGEKGAPNRAYKVNLDMRNHCMMTPLEVAVQFHNIGTANLLLKSTGAFEYSDDGPHRPWLFVFMADELWHALSNLLNQSLKHGPPIPSTPASLRDCQQCLDSVTTSYRINPNVERRQAVELADEEYQTFLQLASQHNDLWRLADQIFNIYLPQFHRNERTRRAGTLQLMEVFMFDYSSIMEGTVSRDSLTAWWQQIIGLQKVYRKVAAMKKRMAQADCCYYWRSPAKDWLYLRCINNKE